jgi:Ni,Fe-hydrogenase III large subunit
MDRVTSTGVLEKQIAHDLSISGVMARASGINRDMRRDFPHEQYRAVKMTIPVHNKGDVLCRLRVRVEEVEQSVAIIRQILEHPRTGEIRIPNQPLEGGRYGLGYTEGWRGAIYYWIQIGLDHQIQRCKIRDASFCNWTGMPFAVPGNIIPDFPLINKSFNLSYSGNDL